MQRDLVHARCSDETSVTPGTSTPRQFSTSIPTMIDSHHIEGLDMNFLKTIAPTVIARSAEIEFVEVAGGGETASDSTQVGDTARDNVANIPRTDFA